MSTTFDIIAHITRQIEWSARTFGPDARTKGVIDHIRKELAEIEAKPHDLSEFVDVLILAIDGAWRMLHATGRSTSASDAAQQIIAMLAAKQAKNESRTWPDWRTMPADRAIEHVRGQDEFKAGDVVRYGTSGGSTALMRLKSPHAGGWHGEQFFGGITYSSQLQRPSAEDMRRWNNRVPCQGGGYLSGPDEHDRSGETKP